MNQIIKHLENGDFEVMKDTKKLIKTLDKYFSQFIRLRDTDSQGYGNCITCHKELKWSDGNETHNGHFATRNNMSTRWDERNCNIQCNCLNFPQITNYDILNNLELQILNNRTH